MQKGLVVIVSAPSGAGKTTICRRLLQRRKKNLRYSISCTTRPPRRGEKDGRHYFFLTKKQFRQEIEKGQFLEWAQVHDNYYGTPRRFVEEQTNKGIDVLMAIDVQGALAVQRKWKDAVLIFVLPPSWRALRGRLERRREKSVEKRLRNAKGEFKKATRFDYIILNERVDKAVRRVEAITLAERLRTVRQAERVKTFGGTNHG